MIFAVVFGRPRSFCLTAFVLVSVLAACGGSSKHARPGAPPVNGKNSLTRLAIGAIDVESVGPDVKIPNDTKKKILAVAQKYVDTAVLAPYNTGSVDRAYDSLFDNGVRAAATTVDKGALTDDGVGKATSYTQSASPVRLSALADGSGQFLYLAANFFEDVDAKTAGGNVLSGRNIELTFAPRGSDWLITAYRVKVLRKLPTGSTTTTVASAGGKTR